MLDISYEILKTLSAEQQNAVKEKDKTNIDLCEKLLGLLGTWSSSMKRKRKR